MKNKRKKTIVKILAGVIVAGGLTFSASPVSAIESFRASTIYKYDNIDYIGPGIRHESINMLTTEGLWHINVIRVDMENEYTELKGLINPEGLHYRDTVSNMVNKSQAIAGVNGDYFNYSPKPSAMGTLINDGKVISSPIEKAYALPTFYLDYDNKGKVDFFHRIINVTNTETGQVIGVNTLNKLTSDCISLTILDKNWGYQSVGNQFHKDLVEVIIEDDIVKDVRVGQAPVSIPRNGYVIAGRGDRAIPLKEMKPGTKLKLDVNTTPDLTNIKFAIGGGSMLVNNGELTRTNIKDSGKHPRTGIGINKDNTELILVTVDGRSSFSDGMTQQNFAKLLKGLGAHYGLNLDGGGSTTMAVRQPENKYSSVVNKPSGGSQRKVVNGVGVFSSSPENILNRIEIELEDSKMFKGTSNAIKIKAYDGYKNPMDLNKENLEISFEGEGASLEDNILRAEKEGKIVLQAKYSLDGKEFTDEKEIQVLGELKNLNSDIREIEVDPAKEYNLPNFIGEDAGGRKAKLSTRDLDFELIGKIGSIENNKFISSEEGVSGYIHASFAEGSENIKIISKINPEINLEAPATSSLEDPLKKDVETQSEKDYKLAVFSDTKNWVKKPEEEGYNQYQERLGQFQAKLDKSKVLMSLNGFSKELTAPFKGKAYINSSSGYSVNKRGDFYMVSLDARNGGLTKTNSYQWVNLRNAIRERPENNIILTIQRPITGPGGFKDPVEAQAFHDVLLRIQESGKNVFLVHGGSEYSSQLVDGIRYIGIDSRSDKPEEAIKNLSFVEFTVIGDQVSYQFKKVFE